ncbi:hypothetical protein HRbin19_00325 [bacterium HR19]|nr:hypothetical protein HRbin19_00325 [bacterium HR19]
MRLVLMNLFFLLLFISCSSKKFYVVIDIKSRSPWVISKGLSVGDERAEKKADVKLNIVDYEESPYFFDSYGNPKAYRIFVRVSYEIRCEKGFFAGNFSFYETFNSYNPQSYRASVIGKRKVIERRLVQRVISEVEKACFR